MARPAPIAAERGEGPETRIAILGGTFDPIHNGHLALADAVARALELDRVVFMPTGNPSFKQGQKVTPAAERAQMTALAIAGDPRFSLDCREIARAGVTYTLDTLEELHAEHPGAHLYFILGADSAETLVHWKGAARLAELATFVVAARPGVDMDRVRQVHDASPLDFDLEFIEAPQWDVSSTELRLRISCGQPVSGLMPDAVIAYIEEHGLYRDEPAEHED
ncbi:MAG: nicotinate-nucleotide adenylyltransferase [Coriobacteriales bacterium]